MKIKTVNSRSVAVGTLIAVVLSQSAWMYRDRLCCLPCPSDYLTSGVGAVTGSPPKISFEVFDAETNLLRTLQYGDVVNLDDATLVRSRVATGPGRVRNGKLCQLPICNPGTMKDTILHVETDHPVGGVYTSVWEVMYSDRCGRGLYECWALVAVPWGEAWFYTPCGVYAKQWTPVFFYNDWHLEPVEFREVQYSEERAVSVGSWTGYVDSVAVKVTLK
jgi:hypothetical protein